MAVKPRKGPGGLWYVDVDGQEYSFVKWGAEKSLDVLSEIGDLVGKPLGAMLGSALSGEGLRTKVTGDLAGTIIGGLTRKMRKNKVAVIAVLKALTSGSEVTCAGKAVSFDSHFEDKLWHMFAVARAGLEVQYGSFFAAARDKWVQLQAEADPDSTQASATSTG